MVQLHARDRISLDTHTENLSRDAKRLIHPDAKVVISPFESLTLLHGELHIPFEKKGISRFYLERIAQQVNIEPRLRRSYLGSGALLTIAPDVGPRRHLEAHGFDVPLEWVLDTEEKCMLEKRLNWATEVLFYMSLNSKLLKPEDVRLYTPTPFDTYPPGKRSW